jgi:DnaJ homolog subfamily C member 19
MVRVVLIVGLVIAGYWAVQWLLRQAPAARLRVAKWTFAVVGLAVALVLLTRAGMYWQAVMGSTAFAGLRAVYPWLVKALPFAHRAWRGRSERRKDNTSTLGSASARVGMSRAEALSILGLKDGASSDEIKRVSAELLRSVGPDGAAGSAYLASQIGEARHVLLS